MDYASPLALLSRRFGQRLGILRPMVRLWRRYSGYKYEDAFERVMFANLTSGDVVWDVGANVGHYTRMFANVAGPSGAVVAFEPSPVTVQELRESTKELGNVVVEAVALSDSSGESSFYFDPRGGSPVDGLSPTAEHPSEAVVSIRRGDEFLPQYPPTKIKIDVEGFEHEVLSGMPRTLRCGSLKAVFIEVHFQTLARRGKANAPADIARMLLDAGFRVMWTDSSHICAFRN